MLEKAAIKIKIDAIEMESPRFGLPTRQAIESLKIIARSYGFKTNNEIALI